MQRKRTSFNIIVVVEVAPRLVTICYKEASALCCEELIERCVFRKGDKFALSSVREAPVGLCWRLGTRVLLLKDTQILWLSIE
jgi:hypothetical protein